MIWGGGALQQSIKVIDKMKTDKVLWVFNILFTVLNQTLMPTINQWKNQTFLKYFYAKWIALKTQILIAIQII